MPRIQSKVAAVAAIALAAPFFHSSPAHAATAPAPASVTPGANSIAVAWTADAASFPKGYVAEAYTIPGNILDDTCGTAVATASTCTILGLNGGQAYTVLVSGLSATETRETVLAGTATPWGVPSQPGTPTATAGNTRVAFTWTAPSDNGKPIQSYNVLNQSGGGVLCTVAAPTTSCVASGLTNGTAYSATVVAINEVGLSPASGASTPVTPLASAGAPAVPTIGTATVVTSSSVSVAFTPGAAVSGFPVTAFTAICTSSGGATGTASGVGSPIIVSGLTPGATYTCTVTATNINSTSNASASSAPVTPGTGVPSAPTSVTGVSTANGQVTVSWVAPSPVPTSGYQVQYRTDLLGSDWLPATPLTSSSTSLVVDGLTNGIPYLFRVRSNNGAGLVSAYVESVTAVTPGNNPAAPATLSVVPGDGRATLNWTILLGSAPTGYAVQYSTDSVNWLPATPQLTGSTNLTYTFTGLTNGTGYFFRVRALNGVLVSAWTTTTTAVVPVALPGTPTSVVGLSGPGQVLLSWTAPTVTAASPVTGYKVQYSSNGGSSWTAGPTSTTTSATVSGLTNGTSYVFQVRATNGSGDGPWSATSAAVVPGAPAAPTSLTAVAGDRSAALTWTLLIGAAPTGFEVQYSTDSVTWLPSTPIPTGSTALTYTLTGLTNGTPYYLRVRAMNGSAASAWTQMSGTVTPVQPRSIEIIDFDRNRQGYAVVAAEVEGFSVGSAINVRFRTYSNGKWRPWKLYGEAIVQRGGLVTVTIDRTGPLKVRFVKDGVNSQTVTIPRG